MEKLTTKVEKLTTKVLSEKQRNWISAKWHDKDVDLKKTIRAAGIFTIVIGVLQVFYIIISLFYSLFLIPFLRLL